MGFNLKELIKNEFTSMKAEAIERGIREDIVKNGYVRQMTDNELLKYSVKQFKLFKKGVGGLSFASLAHIVKELEKRGLKDTVEKLIHK